MGRTFPKDYINCTSTCYFLVWQKQIKIWLNLLLAFHINIVHLCKKKQMAILRAQWKTSVLGAKKEKAIAVKREDNFDLENKTALEIATMLLYNSQEASRSDKQNLRFIKSLLENEANPDFKVK